ATIVYPASASIRGPMDLVTTASAVDEFSGNRIVSSNASGLQVLAAAALRSTVLPAPITVSTGQQFSLAVDVTNDGDVATDTLSIGASVLAGPGTATPVASGSYPQTIAGGQTTSYAWTFLATGPGEISFGCSGMGNDAMSGLPASFSDSWAPILVQSAA